MYPEGLSENFSIQAETWLDSLVGQFRHDPVHAGRGGRTAAADRVRQRRQHAAGARHGAREGDGHPRRRWAPAAGDWCGNCWCESLLLALGGAAVGCLFAYAGIKALVGLIPDGAIPHGSGHSAEHAGAALQPGSGGAHGPAVRPRARAADSSRRDIVEPLKDSGKGVSGGFRRGKLRNALVVVEVALSLVLLAGAGLLMRSFVGLQIVDLGFNPENILVSRACRSPRGQYDGAERPSTSSSARCCTRLRACRGWSRPRRPPPCRRMAASASDIEIPGKTHSRTWQRAYQLCQRRTISPHSATALMRGRFLYGADVDGARKVAVVNQTLVKSFSATRIPSAGRSGSQRSADMPRVARCRPVFEIVGVVADMQESGITGAGRCRSCWCRTPSPARSSAASWCGRGRAAGHVQHRAPRDLGVDRNIALTV